MIRRIGAAGALVLTVILATAAPAWAHATLEATSPADGTHMDQAPPAVSLTFSEDIGAPLGAVRVFDAQGKRVDDGDVVARNETVSVGMDRVSDGGYIVTWRVDLRRLTSRSPASSRSRWATAPPPVRASSPRCSTPGATRSGHRW